MNKRLPVPIAVLLVVLFVASLAGDGLFSDAQVTAALPWYGALYHVLKTFVASWWATQTITRRMEGTVRLPSGLRAWASWLLCWARGGVGW